MAVSFALADVKKVSLTNRKELKKFISLLFERENRSLVQLTYVFTSDEFLLELNKRFLKHDYYTDVITFNLSENENNIRGEAYISIERVKENSRIQQVSFSNELLRTILHGALHLCGFNDKSGVDIELMRRKEDEYLILFKSHVSRETPGV